MENNKLMILGTNEYQNPLIIHAKELGFETHVYGWPVGEIGEKTADYYHPIDVMNYDVMWEECQKLQPCGVVSICSEVCMHPVNYLLRKMGMPCNSEWTEMVSTDKYLMRMAMKEAGLDGPKFMLIKENMTINDILTEIKDYQFPLIVKPVDLSSSRGVCKIDNRDCLQESVFYAMNWSEKKEVILEEFIEGQEYSGESIAYKGEYKLLAVTEKHTTGAPHFVETGHRQPANLSTEMHKIVEETLYKAFAALKIEYGAIHPEFRITPDGRVLFMEIATRMGGDCIGTDLTPLSTGYDFMGMVINIGCGKAPDFTKTCKPKTSEIHYIVTQEDLNEYKKICIETPNIIWRSSDIKNLTDKPVLKSADRAGYYITVR